MRWFKCLTIAAAHLFTHISLIFITQNDSKFVLNFSLFMGSIMGTIMFGCMIIFISFKRDRYIINRLVIALLGIFYCACLTTMLYTLQYWLIRSTVQEVYSISGQIGLTFLILVLYDRMKTDTETLYQETLEQMLEDDEMVKRNFEISELGLETGKI